MWGGLFVKKRMFAWLLALALAAGLLPTGALAAGNQLYWRGGQIANNVLTPEGNYSTGLSGQAGNSSVVALYTDNTSGTPMAAGAALTYTPGTGGAAGDVTVGYDDTLQGWIIQYHAVCSGTLSAVTGGTTYSLDVSAVLPDVGLYSANAASAENFISSFTVTGSNRTFYLCANTGWTLTGVTQNSGSFAEIAISEDKRDAAITVSDSYNGEQDLSLAVSAGGPNGQSWSGRYFDIALTDARPKPAGLYFAEPDWGGSGPKIPASPAYQNTALSLTLGYSRVIALYYYDGTGYALVTSGASVAGPFTLTPNAAAGLYDVSAAGSGSGSISYTADETTYTLALNAALPTLGFYSGPTRSEESFLKTGSLTGNPGESKTAYLLWDSALGVQSVSLTAYGDGTSATGTPAEFAAGTKYLRGLTVVAGSSSAIVTGDVGLVFSVSANLTLSAGGQCGAAVNFVSAFDSVGDGTLPTVTYNGVQYALGPGFVEDGRLTLLPGGSGFGGSGDESGCSRELMIGAKTGYGTAEECDAPADFYQYITGVTMELEKYQNLDGSGQTEPNGAFDAPARDYSFNGCTAWAATLRAAAGKYFTAIVKTTITVTLPGEQPQTLVTRNNVHYLAGATIDLDAGSASLTDSLRLDTAAKLNAALASDQAFFSWFAAAWPEKYAQYNALLASGADSGSLLLDLHLPSVTYDDVVTVGASPENFSIIGFTDENSTGARTVLPGMRVTGAVSTLADLNFAAVSGKTQSYGGDAFTCGVLAAGSGKSDVGMISSCTFTGLDYGVRSTSSGYAAVSDRNVFKKCGCGIYMDCAGKTQGNMNSLTVFNRYERCGTAVRIVSLPDYMTPYMLRVYDSDFIGNTADIDVLCAGNYYFYRNYFGSITNAAEDISADNAAYRSAVLGQGADTKIITNPRRLDPCTLSGWQSAFAGRGLGIDPALRTTVLNAMAQELVISSDALDGLADGVDIPVVDENGDVVGTWSF